MGWGVGARDVRNAADFLFCVRYAARERVSPCKKCCVFSEPLLSSTLQANTNIPEAAGGGRA